MIDTSHLRFAYGDDGFELAIEQLSVSQGERVAIVGPSGSGKTTLLHLIAGVLTPRTGDVHVAGNHVSNWSESARRDFRIRHIGLVFQEFELLDHLNVRDNILLSYRLSAALRLTSDVRRRALELAERLEVRDKLSRRPHQLSQGERQRAAICRALLPDPPLLLADEPTGNLDPVNKDRVLDLLLEYVREKSVTLVMVTHDYSLLDRFTRVIDFREFHPTRVQPKGRDDV